MLRRTTAPGVGTLVFVALLSGRLVTPPRAQAQAELGCCQFTTRPVDGGGRLPRCADTTRLECTRLRPNSVFFRRWGCDDEIQRCVIGFRTRTPTPTATPTATRTATRAPERIGCCQLDDVDRAAGSLCANAIKEASCLTEYQGTATFCAGCSCSAAPQGEGAFVGGTCATNTPRPTATPTPAEPRGCCQLNRSRGPHASICGNDIAQSNCLADFSGGATFCADCVCSSHTEAGIDLAPGVCQPRPPTPRPRHPRHPSRRPLH